MSARSDRKSAELELTPALHRALAAYRDANRDRSMAAAARRAVRAALGFGGDRRADATPSKPASRLRPVRLQLEPALRAALPRIGDGDGDAIIALLNAYLLDADLTAPIPDAPPPAPRASASRRRPKESRGRDSRAA